MSKVKVYNTKSLYFSERITKAMHKILDHPLTIVEAPMGYGKTTAVREYLNKAGVSVLWQRVYDSSASSFWQSFGRLFRELDDDRSQSLVRLGFPGDGGSMQEALKLIGELELPAKTVLIIDDYHLIDSPGLNRFIELLVENEIANLHIVLTTRFTKFQNLDELALKGYLLHITKETLELMPKEIAGYYRGCGITLKDTEADRLYSVTEGWISALYLFMLEFIAEGSYTPAKNIHKILEKAVYAPLADEIKDFLLTMCIFDSFTHEQAVHMWGEGNTSKFLAEITNKNTFVKYDSRSKSYQMHNIFTGFLKEVLAGKEMSYKQDLYQKAAQWYLKTGDYLTARRYFYVCGDFDQLLLALEEDGSNNFTIENKELLKKYMAECPRAVKARHHYAVLIFALHLFIHNEHALFEQVCREFSNNIEMDENLEDSFRSRMLGEFELLLSFAAYNDIKNMSAHHRKACELLNRPTSIYDSKPNWTFGSPTVLYLYYRESGKLAEHVKDLKEALPYYYRLTEGHGSGAEYVMEAEGFFNRGDFENAEISVYKAWHKAQANMEASIAICAVFLQIRLAFMQGDFARMLELLHKLRNDMTSNKEYHNIHTVEICEGSIYSYLDQKDKIPVRLLEGDFNNIRLRFPAFGVFNIIYGRVLLLKGEFLKLIGSAEHFIGIASVFSNLLGHIYTYIYLAAANQKIFREAEALSNLKQALEIAMPDRIYMPFVENCDYIAPLLEKLAGEGSYREDIARILALYETYRRSKEQIILEHFTAEKPKLTQREMEIARLAAAGITNSEIGKRLHISANTVKMALKSIYAKLSINNRTLLEQHLDNLEQ